MEFSRNRPAGRYGEDDDGTAVEKPGFKLPAEPKSPERTSSLLPLRVSIYKYQAPISGVTYVHYDDEPGYGDYPISPRGNGDDDDDIAAAAEWERLRLKKDARKVSLGENQLASDNFYQPSKPLGLQPDIVPESPTAQESTTTGSSSAKSSKPATIPDLNEISEPPSEEPDTKPQPAENKTRKKKKTTAKKGTKTGKAGIEKKRKKKVPGDEVDGSASPPLDKKKVTKKKKKKKPANIDSENENGASSDIEPKKKPVKREATSNTAHKAEQKSKPSPVQPPPVQPPPPRRTLDDTDDEDFGIEYDYSVAGIDPYEETPVIANSKHSSDPYGETPIIANSKHNLPSRSDDEVPNRREPEGRHSIEEKPSSFDQIYGEEIEANPPKNRAGQEGRTVPKRGATRSSNFLSKFMQKAGIKTVRHSFHVSSTSKA